MKWKKIIVYEFQGPKCSILSDYAIISSILETFAHVSKVGVRSHDEKYGNTRLKYFYIYATVNLHVVPPRCKSFAIAYVSIFTHVCSCVLMNTFAHMRKFAYMQINTHVSKCGHEFRALDTCSMKSPCPRDNAIAWFPILVCIGPCQNKISHWPFSLYLWRSHDINRKLIFK